MGWLPAPAKQTTQFNSQKMLPTTESLLAQTQPNPLHLSLQFNSLPCQFTRLLPSERSGWAANKTLALTLRLTLAASKWKALTPTPHSEIPLVEVSHAD